MTGGCIYCGMEIEDQAVIRKIDDENIEFYSRHCGVIFEGILPSQICFSI